MAENKISNLTENAFSGAENSQDAKPGGEQNKKRRQEQPDRFKASGGLEAGQEQNRGHKRSVDGSDSVAVAQRFQQQVAMVRLRLRPEIRQVPVPEGQFD